MNYCSPDFSDELITTLFIVHFVWSDSDLREVIQPTTVALVPDE